MNNAKTLAFLVCTMIANSALADDLPSEWSTFNDEFHNFGTDSSIFSTAPDSYFIQSKPNKPKDNERNSMSKTRGLLKKTIEAEEHAGKKIQISARLKAEQLDYKSFIYVEAKDEKGTLVGAACAVNGTVDWKLCPVTIEIPDEAKHIQIGLALWGNGKVWIDDVAIDEVSNDVPVTGPYHPYKTGK